MKEDTTPIDPTWMKKTGGYARDMTLRDELAARAMQGFIASFGAGGNLDALPALCWATADAMLAAREAK